MKWLMFIIISISSVSISLCQDRKISGFLGSKNALTLKMAATPSYHSQKPNEELSSPGISLNKSYEIEFQRVYKYSKSIGVLVGTSKTSMDLNVDGQSARIYSEDPNIPGYLDEVYGDPIITDTYFGVHKKFYKARRGSIAPLGAYVGWHIVIHNYKFDYTGMEFEFRNESNNQRTFTKLKEPIQKETIPEFGFDFGYQGAVGRHFTYSFGTQFGLLWASHTVGEALSNSDSGLETPDSFLIGRVHDRITSFHLYKFHFSTGFLF